MSVLQMLGDKLTKMKNMVASALPKKGMLSPLAEGPRTKPLTSDVVPNQEFVTPDKPVIPQRLVETINTAAKSSNVHPKVLASLTAQESGGVGYKAEPGASGERGITQIIPKWYYKEAGFNTPEEYGIALESNDEFAVKETARILRKNYTARKSIFDALREYNAGPSLMSGTQYAIEVLKRVGLDEEIPEEYRAVGKAKTENVKNKKT